MDEYVATVLLCDKTKSLGFIEPLHCTFLHAANPPHDNLNIPEPGNKKTAKPKVFAVALLLQKLLKLRLFYIIPRQEKAIGFIPGGNAKSCLQLLYNNQ